MPSFTLTAAVLDSPDPPALARFCGRLAEFQPQDDVRMLLDPAGHPICLWVRG